MTAEVMQICDAKLSQKPAFTKWVKMDEEVPEIIIVSTYQLAYESGSGRTGGIYCLDRDFLEVETEIQLGGGVFRCDEVERGKIVAALTNGNLAFVDLRGKVKSTIEVSENMLLDCSVGQSNSSVLCSDNSGNLKAVDLNAGQISCNWSAHKSPYEESGCEVWCCSWLNGESCASGAEDGLLKVWDIRDTGQPQLLNRSHSAGVVFLRPIPEADFQIISGSYDDHIRSFDIRRLDKPLAEKKLNGGVWHVEYIGKGLSLAACMYGGWSILSYSNAHFELLHCQDVNGPELLYGASALRVLSRKPNQILVASTTFNNSTIYLESVILHSIDKL